MSEAFKAVAAHLQSYGFHFDPPTPANARGFWKAKCSCGVEYVSHDQPTFDPKKVIVKLRQRGHSVASGREMICSTCLYHRRTQGKVNPSRRPIEPLSARPVVHLSPTPAPEPLPVKQLPTVIASLLEEWAKGDDRVEVIHPPVKSPELERLIEANQACAKAKAEAVADRRNPEIDEIMRDWKPSDHPTVPAPAPVVSIGPSPKTARLIYDLLTSYYQEDDGRYVSGWDDARVAGEVKVSVDMVARIRDEAYGPLADDKLVKELRDDIEMLKMEIADCQERFAKEMSALAERSVALDLRAVEITTKKAA